MNKKELSAYFSKLGKKGGKKTKEMYGMTHFINIGKKGGRTKLSTTKPLA